MRFFFITCVATPALLGQGVTIDEFSVRPLEFVEIGNGSALPMDISGFVVESRDASLALLVQTIPPATILLPGESWVIGEAAVPNVDQVLSGPMFDDATGAITLRDPGNQIVDTVGYGNPPAALLPFTEGEGLFGAQSPVLPNTWQRLVTGWDTGDNGIDFRLMPPTPGQENTRPLLPPYGETFDALPLGQPVQHWAGTRFQPVCIEPTNPSPLNPQPIPPSPQGGRAAQFGDPTGNGNQAMMLCSPMDYLLLELWIWIDLSVPGAAWSVGVHGHSDGVWLPPDPLNPLAQPDNGDTGLCWTMVCTAPGQGGLFLVDNGNGGTDHVLLGQIPLQSGLNDGWQRLRIECVETFAECRFGGNYGQLDGQMLAGDLGSEIGGIYVSSFRPGPGPGLIVDALALGYPAGYMSHAEFGIATTLTLPQISGNSFPRVGNAGFALRAHDLAPFHLGMIVVGLDHAAVPLVIIGATSGTFLWNTGELLHVVVADPLGQATLPLPIPPDPSLGGFELSAQAIDFDPNLPGNFRLGHSDALDFAFWGPPTVKIWPAGALGTNICIYDYVLRRGGRGPCPLGAAGTICVNCPGPGGCPGPNLRVLVHDLRNVHVCTVDMFRQGGAACVPQASCPAGASRNWNF